MRPAGAALIVAMAALSSAALCDPPPDPLYPNQPPVARMVWPQLWQVTEPVPIDASGSLKVGGQKLRFEDGVDLAHQLATHDTVRDCYAQRWTNYALGYPVDPTDPDMERLLKGFRKDDRVLTLLEEIATSEMFRYRALGGAK